jgi:hypothetical protein
MSLPESLPESLDACRSRFVWRALTELSEHQRREATTRVQGLPLSIRSQGLGVAVAILLREGKSESKSLADLLGRWLLKECPVRVLEPSSSLSSYGSDLLRAVVVCTDPIAAGAATEEAITLAGTIKLLASALAPEAVHEG